MKSGWIREGGFLPDPDLLGGIREGVSRQESLCAVRYNQSFLHSVLSKDSS